MNEHVYSDCRTRIENESVLISLIVPVYNTAEFLEETLSSISGHGRTDVEIIIVDDGSTDESHETIKQWLKRNSTQVLYVRQQNSGLSAARHTGIKYARGDYIGFCDSDDRLNIKTYIDMAQLSIEYFCDVAICRSTVFDSASGESYDFYDCKIWDLLVENQTFNVSSVLRNPQLLRLEPNANTRIIKREFFTANNLKFPLGLHFEDLPNHLESLVLADKVLLMNSTGYYYRVNRPGKITDQRSEKRFDILEIVKTTFDTAKRLQLGVEPLAYLSAMAMRMLYWCGTNTLNSDRKRFYTEAVKLVRSEVDFKALKHAVTHVLDDREKVLLAAFWTGSVSFLIRHASKNSLRIRDLSKVILSKSFGETPRRLAYQRAVRRVDQLFNLKG